MIANSSSVFWLWLCQCSFPVALLHYHLIPAWEWLPRMGSGSSFQLSQAVNTGQLPQCEMFAHKVLCFGRDQNKTSMLIPFGNSGFPREEESDRSHQQFSLCLGISCSLGQGLDLPCHCSEQGVEAPDQVVLVTVDLWKCLHS